MLPRFTPQLDPGAVLHSNAEIHILAAFDRVDWRDGSLLQLHHVLRWGVAEPQLRALQVDGQWAVLPIPRVAPDLADDIRHGFRTDHAGLIRFTLRGRWASAAGFVAHVRPHLQAIPHLDKRVFVMPHAVAA